MQSKVRIGHTSDSFNDKVFKMNKVHFLLSIFNSVSCFECVWVSSLINILPVFCLFSKIHDIVLIWKMLYKSHVVNIWEIHINVYSASARLDMYIFDFVYVYLKSSK